VASGLLGGRRRLCKDIIIACGVRVESGLAIRAGDPGWQKTAGDL